MDNIGNYNSCYKPEEIPNPNIFEEMFSNIQAGVHVYHMEDIHDDTSFKLIYLNKAAETISGIPNSKIIGMYFDQAYPHLREKGLPEAYARVVRTGEPIKIEDSIYENETDVIMAFSITASPLSGNKICVFFEDITARKIAEKKLRLSEEMYKEIVENAQSAIIKLDTNTTVIYFNEYSEKLFGYKSEEVIGKSIIGTILPRYDSLGRDLKHLISNHMSSQQNNAQNNYTTDNYTRSGKKLTISWTSKPIFDITGKMTGVIVIGTDITDRIQLENELISAKEKAEEANKAKSEFLANMSHEIRTPLNGIIGFSDILMNRETNAEKKEMLEMVVKSGQNLLLLINEILDLSKIESGNVILQHKPFHLKGAVEEAIKSVTPLLQDKGIKYSLNYEIADSIEFIGDEIRIKQILLNLLNNAVKFTEKGYISVKVKLEHQKENSGVIVIEVEDSGIGIPKEKLSKIFDRFYQVDSSKTRKFGGAGLGLSIVSRLLELFEGDIDVKSIPGKGSVFTIRFPLKLSNYCDLSIAQDNQSQVEEKQKKMTVLLVEDTHVNKLLLQTIVQRMGHTAITAENGIKALEMARHNQIDLILMDIQLPDMDGLQVTAQLRRDGFSKGIIAVTAGAMEGDREKCLKAGMDDYITKPFRVNEILDLLKRYSLP